MVRLNNTATAESVNEFVKVANELIKKYKWQGRTVTPYSYPMKITEIVNEVSDYSKCTVGSKHYLVLLANGLADILEAWEKQELKEMLSVRLKNSGKIVNICSDLAQKLLEGGYAEEV